MQSFHAKDTATKLKGDFQNEVHPKTVCIILIDVGNGTRVARRKP